MAVDITAARLQAALFGAREALKRAFPDLEEDEIAPLLATLAGGAIAQSLRRPVPAVQLEVLIARLLLNVQVGERLFAGLKAETDD